MGTHAAPLSLAAIECIALNILARHGSNADLDGSGTVDESERLAVIKALQLQPILDAKGVTAAHKFTLAYNYANGSAELAETLAGMEEVQQL